MSWDTDQIPSTDFGSTNTIERVISVVRMDDVLPHNYPAPHSPVALLATDPDFALNRDDYLNRMMCMQRHNAGSAGERENAAVPQVPARGR